MPGFAGFYDYNEGEELLGKMSNSIMYENWYQVDSWFRSPVGISRIHLGIFNPQPQPVTDGNVYMFMDGKIYDYEEDLKRLKSKGYTFRVNNDVEFCLNSYKESGINFVKKLNGIFTIIIFSPQENKIIILNDRYGFRPFYYYKIDRRLIFASEIKPLLQYDRLRKEIDEKALYYILRFGHLLGNETLFRNVSVLPPASIFTFNNGDVKNRQYWTYKFTTDPRRNEKDTAKQLTKCFRRAVKIRMEDELKYGVSLSGGLDSRCIIGAVDKTKYTYAYTFGIKGSDDIQIAKQVVKVTKKDNPLLHYKIIEIYPEMLIQTASETMFLSEGMDIILVAYLPYVHKKMKELMDVSFTGLALDLLLGGSYLNKRLLSIKNHSEVINYISGKMSNFTEDNLRDLLKSNYYVKVKELNDTALKAILNSIDEEHAANRSDTFFLQTHVRRFTLMGSIIMRSQVEELIPTFDNHFIDLLLTIPPEMRSNHRIYFQFLKSLAPELARIPYQKTMVPLHYPRFISSLNKYIIGAQHRMRRILWYCSRGNISIPYKHCYIDTEEWLRSNIHWQKFIRETLLSKRTLSKAYFNSGRIKKLITDHESGLRDHNLKLMYLVSFELFLREFFG